MIQYSFFSKPKDRYVVDAQKIYSIYIKNVALLNCRMDDRLFITESYPAATTPCLWFLEVLLAIRKEMIAIFIHSANFLAMEIVLLRHLISKPCFFRKR